MKPVAVVVLMLAGCPSPRTPVVPPRPQTPVARPSVHRFVPPEAYRQFLLAELARGKQRPGLTLSHLRRALSEDPGSPYLRLRIAELLLAGGRLAEALKITRAALRVAPSYARSYVVLGRLLAVHQPRRALPVLQRALRMDPDNEQAHLWLARVWLRLGNAKGERAVLERLLKRRLDNAEALFGLARSWARVGRRARTIGLLERLLRAHPFAVLPRLLLSRQLLQQGRVAKAGRALLDAMEASADDPLVAQELFRLYRVSGQKQQADDLVKLMGVHASARFLTFVATLYDSLSQPASALRAVKRALQQDGRFGPALALQARLILRSRGPRAALATLRRITGGRSLAAVRVAQAEILENEGRPRAAIRLIRKTLRKKPRKPELQETLALIYARQGRVTDALRAATAAGRLRNRAPDDAGQRYFLALVLEEAGQFSRSSRITRRLIRDDPDDAQALNLLGYALAERSQNLPEAVRLLQRAQQINPLSPFILDSLGWARHRQGLHRQAVTLLRRATLADSRLAEPWDHLGDALGALGRGTEAVRAYRRALARRPAAYRRAVIAGKIARLQP